MSSAIQCLSNVPHLTKWIMQQHSTHNKNVIDAYISLIQLMWSGKYSSVNCRALKTYMSKYTSNFDGNAQKDAHEFMNYLLNVLHKESQDDSSEEEQQSIITDLFQIQIESRVTCTGCNNCDSSQEVTYCLQLPLAEQPTDTLDELLEDFLKERTLSGSYDCSACQTSQTAKQKSVICFPLPPVVIVQLKRFTFDESHDKLSTFVKYPVLDWNIQSNSNIEQYNLMSVVQHVGNLKSGHYTTLARLNGDGPWHSFNDDLVQPVSDASEIVNQNAYVLLYLKKQNTQLTIS